MSRCKECGLYENARSPRIKGVGNIENPDVVFLIDHPRPIEDRESVPLSGNSIQLLERILESLGKTNYYITCAVKCVPWDDNISQVASRTPTDYEIDCCKDYFLREAKFFGKNTVIVTLGATALKSLIGLDDGITKNIGKYFSYIHTETEQQFTVVAAPHPAWVIKNGGKMMQFQTIIEKAFKIAEGVEIPEDGKPYKILKPYEAIEWLRNARKLFEEGKIDYWILDTETTSLDPWQIEPTKAEIIMYSFTHLLENKGLSVPLKITNTNHHADYPYPVGIIEWDTTPQEIAKVHNEIRLTCELIPIVGHNIKFDIKYMTVQNHIFIPKIKVKEDTLLLAMLVYNRVFGFSLALKHLCRTLLEVPDDWEIEIEEYRKRFRLVKDRHFGMIPTAILGKYAALDASYNKELYEHLKEKSIPDMDYIRSILRKAIIVFADAEVKGAHVDVDLYKFLDGSYKTSIASIFETITNLPTVKNLIDEKLVGIREINSKKRLPKSEDALKEMAFSLGSIMTLKELIYDKWKLPVLMTTEKGAPATGKEALDKLLAIKDLPEEPRTFITGVKNHKVFSKLKSTYIDNVPDKTFGDMFKSEFNLAGTITGRLSSGFHVLPSKCFTGDTLISLLNGTEASIKDLVGLPKFGVYSYDISTNSIVPGIGHSARITGVNQKIFEVELDNGEKIKCTECHPFLTKSNKYKMVKFLKENESLQPLYRKKDDDGYEHILTKDGWKKTHRIVFEWKYGNSKFGNCYLAHHKDFNKENNNPNNLVAVNWKSHFKYHSSHTSNLLLALGRKGNHPNQRPENKKRLSEFFKEQNRIMLEKGTHPSQKPEFSKMRSNILNNLSEKGEHPFQDKEFIKRNSLLTSKRNLERNPMDIGDAKQKFKDTHNKNNSWFFKNDHPGKLKSVTDKTTKSKILKITKQILLDGKELCLSTYTSYKKDIYKYGPKWEYVLNLFENIENLKKETLNVINHKIVSIKFIGYDDVYDFEVDKYHNFALSSGVFVHNSDIKRMYDSRWKKDGGVIVCADYSQLELRIAASLSKEMGWIEAYKKGIDIHSATGGMIYGIDPSLVTKDQRSHGKTINFGILYGKGPQSLAEDLNISIEAATNMIANFFKGAPNLKLWIDHQHRFVRENGFIVTAFNRVIPIEEGLSLEKWKIAEAERRAVNYPVQSSASDLVLASVIRLYDHLQERKLKSIIIGSVHDSIELDVYPGELIEIINLIKLCSETESAQLYKDWLYCPIVMDVDIGDSWGSAIAFKILEKTDNKLVLRGEALRKDFNLLMLSGEPKYNFEFDIKERKPLEIKDFKIDQFIRDREKWDAIVTITNKN